MAWNLIAGNFVYEIYRSILLVAGLAAFGGLILIRRIRKDLYLKVNLPLEFVLPWAFGLVPALLLYTETRFKVVSESLLFLFVIVIWSKLSAIKSEIKK
jgi:hypothetical protein